jgi:glutathione S-transferase
MPEPLPILYSSVRSPHCFKVSLFLHEKGVAFDRVEIDLPAKQQRTPAYLAINPLGQVPVFADDQGVHVDSLRIMRHLDARHGPHRLFPTDDEALQEVLAWIDLSSTAMRDVSHHLYWLMIEPPAQGADPEAVARLTRQGLDLLEQVDGALRRGGGWLAGSLSAADLSVFAWLHGFRRFDLPPAGSDFPHLEAWLERLTQRPSFAASYAQVGRPFGAAPRADRTDPAA